MLGFPLDALYEGGPSPSLGLCILHLHGLRHLQGVRPTQLCSLGIRLFRLDIRLCSLDLCMGVSMCVC